MMRCAARPLLFRAVNQNVDKDGLREFSVVYTDRSLNHMSKNFGNVMRDLNKELSAVYNAERLVVVPGSGTFGMEAVARQFAANQDCLIVRNGFFSFRWTQILDMGKFAKSATVLKARRAKPGDQEPFAPAPIAEVCDAITAKKPGVVFAPHVDTAAGMMLPPEYIQEVSKAVRKNDGLFVLDCIASGCEWVKAKSLGVDVVISAPQKSWSSTPCAGLVLLGDRGLAKLRAMPDNASSSFSMDLKKWLAVSDKWEDGAHMYHATMPTDGLRELADRVAETKAVGYDAMQTAQRELGAGVRKALKAAGYPSVAAAGFEAPGVVVSYTTRDDISTGKAFVGKGVQIAGGVPLQLDEGAGYKSFRIGLFGLDKLKNAKATVKDFEAVLDAVKQ